MLITCQSSYSPNPGYGYITQHALTDGRLTAGTTESKCLRVVRGTSYLATHACIVKWPEIGKSRTDRRHRETWLDWM